MGNGREVGTKGSAASDQARRSGHLQEDWAVQIVASLHGDVDRIAEVCVEQPAHRNAIMLYLHRHHPELSKRVVAAMAGAKKDDAHNVDLETINGAKSHSHGDTQGVSGVGVADPNRITLDNKIDEAKAAPQPASKGKAKGKHERPPTEHGDLINLATDSTEVLDNHGNPIVGHAIPARPPAIQLNAGAVKSFRGADGQPRPCVFAFALRTLELGDGLEPEYVSGWVPVANLDPLRRDELLARDKEIAKEVNAKLRGKGVHGTKHKVRSAPLDETWKQLHTMPNQKPNSTVNLAEHYCTKAGEVINLCANVPGTGGHRWGVANDVLKTGTDFYADMSIQEHVPLWEEGEPAKLTRHTMTFVFGYIEDPGESSGRRYGWLNRAAVGPTA